MPDEAGTPGSAPASNGVVKPLSGNDVVASTRCGLCNLVVEQKLRDGRVVVLLPYVLCMSCDEVRCSACWDAEDDACADADEHEYGEVIAVSS